MAKTVWIVVAESRALAEAKTAHDRAIYAMFYSTKPTVFRSYSDAYNAKRRQLSSYRRMMKRDNRDMGRGFKKMLRDWMQSLNIIRVEVSNG